MVVAPSAEAERPREHAAAAPALLPRIGCRQRRSDQRRREWRSGQRPMQRPLRRVHLLAVCQPAVPNLSGGGRGTKPPGRYSALKPPICTRQRPRQTSSRSSIDRAASSTRAMSSNAMRDARFCWAGRFCKRLWPFLVAKAVCSTKTAPTQHNDGVNCDQLVRLLEPIAQPTPVFRPFFARSPKVLTKKFTWHPETSRSTALSGQIPEFFG